MNSLKRISIALMLVLAFALDSVSSWVISGVSYAMAFALSTGQRNDIRDVIDVYDSGTLEIRTGAPPGPELAPTGTVLATITLPADAWTATDGVLTLNGTWQDSSADATGTAGHFRVVQSGDGGGVSSTDERLEGTITVTSGGGDMELDNTSINAGQQVTINTFTVTVPVS